MKAKLINYTDNWQAVKNAAMNTIGKEAGKYPSSEWKRKMLLAEHSPIRLLEFTVRLIDVPYYVAMHFCRHKIGVEHFVQTQRTDRTGTDRNGLPQGALVNHTMRINAQALINISRKRLCMQASPETRAAWRMVIDAIGEREPEIKSVCIRNCIYKGFCPEMKSCGYCLTKEFAEGVEKYRHGSMERYSGV